MKSLAVIGAVVGPLLAWGALRRVPIWRAAVGTAVGGLIGAIVGLLTLSGSFFLFFTVAGTGLAAWRLQRRYAAGTPSLPESEPLPGRLEA